MSGGDSRVGRKPWLGGHFTTHTTNSLLMSALDHLLSGGLSLPRLCQFDV